MESFPSSKRNDQRFPIAARVRYRLVFSPDGSQPETELHNGNNVIWNISRTGLFFATKDFLEVNSKLEVEFPLDDMQATLSAEAEVVRANFLNNPNQGRYEYGLRFITMDAPSKEVLDKFIALIEKK